MTIPKKFKPVFLKRYVDDSFVLFKRPEHVNPFVDYMNSKLKNVSFTFETIGFLCKFSRLLINSCKQFNNGGGNFRKLVKVDMLNRNVIVSISLMFYDILFYLLLLLSCWSCTLNRS